MNPSSIPVKFPELRAAGRAIYTLDAWKNGANHGKRYVAQVFAEADKDMPECYALLNGSKVIENDVQAEQLAYLLAASPAMIKLVERLANYSHDETDQLVADAKDLLATLRGQIALSEPRSLQG